MFDYVNVVGQEIATITTMELSKAGSCVFFNIQSAFNLSFFFFFFFFIFFLSFIQSFFFLNYLTSINESLSWDRVADFPFEVTGRCNAARSANLMRVLVRGLYHVLLRSTSPTSRIKCVVRICASKLNDYLCRQNARSSGRTNTIMYAEIIFIMQIRV